MVGTDMTCELPSSLELTGQTLETLQTMSVSGPWTTITAVAGGVSLRSSKSMSAEGAKAWRCPCCRAWSPLRLTLKHTANKSGSRKSPSASRPVEYLKPLAPVSKQPDGARPMSMGPRRASGGMPMPDGYLVSTLRRQQQMSVGPKGGQYLSPNYSPQPTIGGQYLSPNYSPQPTIVWNGAAQAAEAAKQKGNTDFGPGSNTSPSGSVRSSKRGNRNSVGPPPSRSSRLGRPAGWDEVIAPIEEKTEYGSTAENSVKFAKGGQAAMPVMAQR
ncbi:hypothetical protein A1Q1_07742 [Trichosporon asahii var. asahii CBS 2479]|uniref:Uncharacterized protein n=1 Tax=Trichosporon asahii var. asahii (strain ATCC 90039 / CBS 2479 / JCM 2466 / KCTC 7840 / NBRC 103889/ NCYC 2677 / UAMH 7654) TaxID=1186058 RepID=J6F6V2_TRIAS|nr:hypothetical protein A1Q1_07742 [Trichosporon asahii var. asahii CBS 2479]EJT51052.1 hypothetical protein A1Q1_07742 [Trichosporon asahii var. asahii CBS 2479]